MSHPVEAFLFDFDHTLGIDNRLEMDVLREFTEEICQRLPDDMELHAVLTDYRTGKATMEKALVEAWQRWECKEELSPLLVKEFRALVLEEAPKRVSPMPNAPHVLEILKAKNIPTAIFTNGWVELQTLKAKLIGFNGPVIVSEAIHAWKPHPIAFKRALSRLHFQPKTTAYIGDSPETDIIGAHAAGMVTVWANLEDHVYPPIPVKPDYTITDLLEILKINGLSFE